MELLVENDADINAINEDNQSALVKTLNRGIFFCKPIQKGSLSKENNKTIIFSCLENERAAEWLVEHGIDVNIGVDSALMIAISKSNRV